VVTRSHIQVGDLVSLNKKGERFIYGKTLCSPYYKPILQGNLGLVLSIPLDKKDMVRVVWFDRADKEKKVIMTISIKYLKRLNKR
jgi:hypothetical protein